MLSHHQPLTRAYKRISGALTTISSALAPPAALATWLNIDDRWSSLSSSASESTCYQTDADIFSTSTALASDQRMLVYFTKVAEVRNIFWSTSVRFQAKRQHLLLTSLLETWVSAGPSASSLSVTKLIITFFPPLSHWPRTKIIGLFHQLHNDMFSLLF